MAQSDSRLIVDEALQELQALRRGFDPDVTERLTDLTKRLRHLDVPWEHRAPAWMAICRLRLELIEPSQSQSRVQELLEDAIKRTLEWATR
jgi:hypothetical protein